MAAIVVILSHLSSRGIYLLPNLNLVGIGKGGVYLFFVLSAFLLTNQFLNFKIDFDQPSMIRYIKKRLLRVYPLYCVFLTFALISSSGWVAGIRLKFPFYLDVGEYIRHLFLLEGKGVAWTIPVEMIYYAWLPIIALICVKGFKNKFLPCVLFLGSSILASFVFGTSNLASNNPLIYTPIFMMGSFLSVLYVNFDGSNENKNAWMLEAAGWLSLVFLACLTPLLMSQLVGYPIERTAFWNEHLLLGLLWCLVLSACIFCRGPLRAIFENRVLRYLGQISFSLYLIHMTVIILVDNLPFPEYLKAVVVLGGTVLVSHFSYFYFEKKFLAL